MFGYLSSLFGFGKTQRSGVPKKHRRRVSAKYNQLHQTQCPKKKTSGTDGSGAGRKKWNGMNMGQKSVIVYHGTPSISTVKSIRRDGWQIGSGNAYGDGVYFSKNIEEARRYAGSSGAVIKCRVGLGKSAVWSPTMEKQFQAWCQKSNIPADASAKTAYLLKNGYKTLQSNSIIVVLKPQFANHSAWRQKIKEISIVSVHKPDTHQMISA